LVRTENKVDIY